MSKKIEPYQALEKIYYNCVFVNKGNQLLEKANYVDNRTEPILKNPSDYTMSVVRFKCDTSNIPFLIAPIQPLPNTNINLTQLSVTLRWTPTGFDAQEFCIFIPEDIGVPVPPDTNDVGETSGINVKYNTYYSIYTIDRICKLINNALNASYAQILAGPFGGIPNATYPCAPQIAFDGKTQLFYIMAPIAYTLSTTSIELYMNYKLYYYFDSSFESDYYDTTQLNGKDSRIYIVNTIDNNLTLPSPFGNSVKYYQSFITLGNISTFNTILFSGNNIPCRYELLPNREVNSTKNQIGNNQFPIITDFTLDNSNGNTFRNQVYYVPTAEYRRTNLLSNTPMYQFDISIYWTDKYNNLYPLVLNASQTCSIKILFEKKN